MTLEILSVEVGSTAHGTGLPGYEDRDEMVIRVESARDVLGLRSAPRSVMERTAAEGEPSGPDDTDRMIYTLRHFLRLATNGNPSVLLALWAPIIETTPLGDELRAMSPHFVGRHLIGPYRGYMQAQVERLKGIRGGRHGRFRDDQAGYDTKYAMHAARLGFQCLELLTTRELRLPIETGGDWLRAVRHGEVPLEEWEAKVAELDASLVALAEREDIPAGPDVDVIETWSVAAHRRAWDQG